MKRILLVFITGALLISASALFASVNPSLVHVYLLDKSDMETLRQMHLDVPFVNSDFAEVVAYPEDIAELNASGLHFDVIHEDLVAFYQSRNPVNTTMGGFLTFPELLDTMDALHTNYPDLISARDSIGATWEGRALWVFKLSDNVDVDEDEPEVMFNALIHAREPESMNWELNFIDWLLANYDTDDDATEIINERELWFCLVNNPDGYEYNRLTNPNGGGYWRKNRRPGGGVDLNRNWGYMWGYDNEGSSPYPSDETYRGPSAFSEPETQALRDFIISRDFKFIINAHTYGNYFIYPFGYENIYSPDQDIFSVIGDSVSSINNYTHGNAWQTVNYPTNGDAVDWQYGDQDSKPLIFAATPETGGWQDGFWPPTYRIPQLNADMLPVGIYIAKIAGNVRAISPPLPPVLDPIGEIDSSAFTVTWTHEDENNPAVAYELVEKSGFARVEDDVESGTDAWILDGFTLRSTRYHSANHSIYSGSGNNYHGEAAMADPITVQEGDTLTFWAWYDIEDGWDYAYVEVSVDGGVSYNPIPGNITTNYDPHGNNRGNGITGSSNNQWTEAIFPLGGFIGQTIRVKFSYTTDQSITGQGFYMDDIYPIETFENIIVLASDITETSYLVEGRPNGTYYYQVRAEDEQDQWSGFSNREEAIVTGQVAIDDPLAAPYEFDLSQNYPNPFNAQTQISFALSTAGQVKLDVFDIAGRIVKNLIDARMEAGPHSIIWNGTNNSGQVVSTGVYFYKLTTAIDSQTRRMTLLK